MKIIFYYCTLTFVLIGQPIICFTQPKVTDKQLQQKNTPIIISFFQKMIDKNIINIAHLKKLQTAHELINPISKTERDSSSETFTWAKQLDLFLKLPVDMTQINEWAIKKIAELERAENTRKWIHEDTRELRVPMRFVPMHATIYTDFYTLEQFEIQDGIEFQTTPVTQWQWASVMGSKEGSSDPGICNCDDGMDSRGAVWIFTRTSNVWTHQGSNVTDSQHTRNSQQDYVKSHCFTNSTGPGTTRLTGMPGVMSPPEAPDPVNSNQEFGNETLPRSFLSDNRITEEVTINGKKIELIPNAPITHISWNDVQEFIKKLNEQDKEYEYAVPSVHEYQAMMLNMFGRHWAEQRALLRPRPYYELNGKRIQSFIGDIWQWTCDVVQYENKQAHLVFGGPHPADKAQKNIVLKNVLRPIFCSTAHDQSIGLRLVCSKKSLACGKQTRPYSRNQFQWNQTDCSADHTWELDQEKQTITLKNDNEFRWIIEHKKDYSAETQELVSALCEDSEYCNDVKAKEDPVFHLQTVERLSRSNGAIQGLELLTYLKNLTRINLSSNQIKDIHALAHLSNLSDLNLNNNQIQNISPLAQLTSLKSLGLFHNQILDVNSIAQLTHLDYLNLSYNKIKDARSLEYLTSLVSLSLDNNQIQDITSLAHLSNLISLWLYNNPIKDLKPLTHLKNLRYLYLDKDQIERFNAYALLPGVNIKEAP